MQQSLQFKSQFFHWENNLFLNPFLKTTGSSKSPIFTTFPLPSRKTQIQKPVTCARKSKRRYEFERSTKVILELTSVLASHNKILPQPLDLVLQILVGDDGGGLGLSDGFKGGSFSGWTRPRRRNGKKILRFFAFLGSCILCVLLAKELGSEVVFGVLGFSFFVVALIKECKSKRGLKDWMFGFCCVGVLIGLGLGLGGNEAMKWIKKITVSSSSASPMLQTVRRSKRRGRWAL